MSRRLRSTCRAEAWAREHGYARITLDTGAANAHARTVYEHLGWAYEDVRMSKAVQRRSPG